MTTTVAASLTEAGQIAPTLSPSQVRCQPNTERRRIDVREQHEFDSGHLPDALHLSRGLLEASIKTYVPDRTTPLTLYCAAGTRSLLAAKTLHDMGYTNVATMTGGLTAWTQQGFPVAANDDLTAAQRDRYARHLLLPEVGTSGQRALLDAKVLIVGAGGLGSPAALYLAAAGVGTLGLIDFDTVEASNLQRQLLHTQARVGMRKTASAKAALNALNSEVVVQLHDEPLTAVNCADLFNAYDLVINGCDNFATRYLVNDVAVLSGTPLVDGSVHRFNGEATVVLPGQTACYRCRYPAPPSPGNGPSCTQAGVLGVLPGIVGTIQATEAIKLILRQGTSLAGRLLRIDALAMSFSEYTVPRDPACPVCGEHPSIDAPIDYVEFCSGVTSVAQAAHP